MRFGLSAALLLITSFGQCRADAFGCNEAIGTFNMMLIDHSEAVSKYMTCLNMSKGKDPCSVEFSKLKRSQADYEMDVGTINQNCNPY